MIAKIRLSKVAEQGKFWTGDRLQDGEVVNARLLFLRCPCCKATTRKLRVSPPVEISPEVLEALEIPTLFVAMGGVRSIAGVNDLDDFACWNWSGRVGGHVFLNPLLVLSGYISGRDLPDAKSGYEWYQTYVGKILSEFVLVRVGPNGEPEESSFLGDDYSEERLCPLCREKNVAEAVVVTDLPVPEPVPLDHDSVNPVV